MAAEPGDGTFTMAQLAAESGVPARTIRYYIARGLLEGPVVAGRGATYTRDHLERLREIKRRQQEGRMLADIAREAVEGPAVEVLLRAESWDRYVVAADVEVMVRRGGAPWRVKRVRQALLELAARLAEPEKEEAE